MSSATGKLSSQKMSSQKMQYVRVTIMLEKEVHRSYKNKQAEEMLKGSEKTSFSHVVNKTLKRYANSK